MLWVECMDGSFFNLEKAMDISIVKNPKNGIFEVRAFFPVVLSAPGGSGADYVVIASGNLDACKKIISNFRLELYAKGLMFKTHP